MSDDKKKADDAVSRNTETVKQDDPAPGETAQQRADRVAEIGRLKSLPNW
jgi:hypothetical protein